MTDYLVKVKYNGGSSDCGMSSEQRFNEINQIAVDHHIMGITISSPKNSESLEDLIEYDFITNPIEFVKEMLELNYIKNIEVKKC